MEESMNYLLEFTIDMLPKMENELTRARWEVRSGYYRTWRRRIEQECWPQRPSEPLENARITLTRFSSGKTDPEALQASFKPIVDGLVQGGIIRLDALEGSVEYFHERAPLGKGSIRVKVVGVA
jgi:hypothetical protein